MTCLSSKHPRTLHPVSRIVYFSFCILLFLSACGPNSSPIFTLVPPTATLIASLSPTEAPTQTPYVITATPQAGVTISAPQGIFFLSLADAGHSHIFAYSPQSLPLTRLTTGEWDDIAPALSPDGTRVAFASDRNGYWDIYILDLQSGETSRLTDSLEYDGNPSWSLPDGAFLTYDSYVNGNLEIFIRSVTDSTQVFRLTQDPATDTSPAWSPQRRQIAFVSNRSGEPEIWVANLDTAGDFINISQSPQSVESHPAWSPDGNQIVWASTNLVSGLTGVYIWDARNPEIPARWVGSGGWPVWQSIDHVVTGLSAPNQVLLAGYDINRTISLPPMLLPGPLHGLTFGSVSSVLPGPFQSTAQITPAPLYNTVLNPQSGLLPGRSSLVHLSGVQAPYPQLHELADDSFQALRNQVAVSTGWDALSNLENAFVPLTTSLDPGLGEDWLYTGRAFTLNPALIQAGWMAIVREDFGQETYWRIYLRTTAQDGSQGAPLTQIPWDFAARTGDPGAYENGGRLMTFVPTGYFLDLTALAIQYGWERLPALTNWRTYYSGARYNELAFTQGLDWRTAMLQVYPPEILVTPTVVIPPTRTPTRIPPFYKSPTPTSTPTLRPTNTP
jgi:TolB protein